MPPRNGKGIYLSVVGIREMHGTTTGKAALVVLIPFAVVLLVAVVVLVAAGIAFYNQRWRYSGRPPLPHIRPKRNALLSFVSPPRRATSRTSRCSPPGVAI